MTNSVDILIEELLRPTRKEARLRRDISAWSVDRDKIRPATPQERKKYFSEKAA